MSDERESFWTYADSTPSPYPSWAHGGGDGWHDARLEQCVGLMSDGNRCHRANHEHGWCDFHWQRVNAWFASSHGEAIARAARRDDPDAFRFLVDKAVLQDAERILIKADSQVYFIACEDAVKVGYSKAPARRLASLKHGRRATVGRTLAPEGMDLSTAEIVGCIPGEQNVERQVHRLLAEYRLVGEWFRITPTVIQAIDCLVFDAEPPRAIEKGLRDIYGREGRGSNRRRNRDAA